MTHETETLGHQELVDVPRVTNLFTLAYPSGFIISNHFLPLSSFLTFLVLQLCILLLLSLMFYLTFLDVLCKSVFQDNDHKNRSFNSLLTFKNKGEFTIKPLLSDRH